MSDEGERQVPRQVVVVSATKSMGVSILLTVLFGPLGLFYSTIPGAIIMAIASLVVAVITVGFGLLLTWPICIIWGAVATSSYNKNLIAGPNSRDSNGSTNPNRDEAGAVHLDQVVSGQGSWVGDSTTSSSPPETVHDLRAESPSHVVADTPAQGLISSQEAPKYSIPSPSRLAHEPATPIPIAEVINPERSRPKVSYWSAVGGAIVIAAIASYWWSLRPRTQDKQSNIPPASSGEFSRPAIASGEVTRANVVSLAPVWHGNWGALLVEPSGAFVKNKVRFEWVGTRAGLPQKGGCWAFYDGVTSKADLVSSFNRVESDAESKANLALLSDERFKRVTLVCTEEGGREIPSGGDCISSGYSYDKEHVYEPVTCQIGIEFGIALARLKRQ